MRVIIFKLIQIQIVTPLSWAFSSPSNVATAAAAAKTTTKPPPKNNKTTTKNNKKQQPKKPHQMFIFIGRLAGRCHFDDLPSCLVKLSPIWSSTHRTAVCMLLVHGCRCLLHVSVALRALMLGAGACQHILNCHPVCNGSNCQFCVCAQVVVSL